MSGIVGRRGARSGTTTRHGIGVIARMSATTHNVTGDGTYYTILFNSVEADLGFNYVPGTGIFTAPLKGTYIFAGSVETRYTTAASQWGVSVNIDSASPRRYGPMVDPTDMSQSADIMNLSYVIPVVLDAGAVCYIEIMVDGIGSKAVQLRGDSCNLSISFLDTA